MIDVVAREIGLDPLEFRRRNILHRSDLPYTSPGRHGHRERHAGGDARAGASTEIGYDAFRAEQAQATAEGRLPRHRASRSTWSRRPASAPTPTSPRTCACTPTVASTCSSAPARTARDSRRPPRSSSPRTSASHYRRRHRAPGRHRQSTPFGPGTGGSRSGPMIGAGRHRGVASCCARRSSPSPRTCSKRHPTTSRSPRASCR